MGDLILGILRFRITTAYHSYNFYFEIFHISQQTQQTSCELVYGPENKSTVLVHIMSANNITGHGSKDIFGNWKLKNRFVLDGAQKFD